MFSCKDLMMLPSFAKAKLIAGNSGVGKTIRWVYKPEDMNFAKWVRGSELLIISVPVIKSSGFDLMELLKKAVKLNMSGMLLLVGDNYIKNISADIITYANRNRFPIFSIPGDTPLIDIFEEIGHAIAYDDRDNSKDDGLFTGIVFGNETDADAFSYKCAKLGYDLDGSHRMFIVRTESPVMMQTYDYEKVLENIKKCFENRQIPVLVTRFGNNFIGCFHDTEDVNVYDKIYRDIAGELKADCDGWVAGMGIGTAYTDTEDFHASYTEASKCIKVLEKLNHGCGIYRYEQTGMYNIYMECSDRKLIDEFIENTLGAVIRYDSENGTDLVDTLESYLMNGGSLLHASEELHMHRNTVRYRIGKIEELTGRTLESAPVRFEMMNAVLCMKLCR